MTPFLLILSAPSGGGKTTIAKALLEAREDLTYSVSATTRAPRQGERDGIDYHFMSDAEFKRRRDEGEFLEWAEYAGCLYGTLRREVLRAREGGLHLVLDIDVQGARAVREHRGDDLEVVSIFILPPNAETLFERLTGRGKADPAQLERRLLRARAEIEEASAYDYIVVNEDRTQVLAEVAAIIDSESRRTCRIESLEQELSDLRQGLTEMAARVAQQQEH